MGHHQDGDTDYSWHCFPVKEEQFIAIQEQDTTERILEHGGETKAYPVPQRPRKGKRMATWWLHCPSSRPVQFLQWKREPRSTTSTALSIVGHFVGVRTLIVYHRDCCRSVGLNNWESDCDGEGRSKNQILDLGRPSSYLKYSSGKSSFAYLQNQVSGAIWPGSPQVQFRSSHEKPNQSWNLLCPSPDKGV